VAFRLEFQTWTLSSTFHRVHIKSQRRKTTPRHIGGNIWAHLRFSLIAAEKTKYTKYKNLNVHWTSPHPLKKSRISCTEMIKLPQIRIWLTSGSSTLMTQTVMLAYNMTRPVLNTVHSTPPQRLLPSKVIEKINFIENLLIDWKIT